MAAGAREAASGIERWVSVEEQRVAGTVCVLDLAPELTEGLSAVELPLARREARASVCQGSQRLPPALPRVAPGCLGFIVAGGFLLRSVRVGRARRAELLGVGSVLSREHAGGPSSYDVRWEVLDRRASVAVLDARFAARTVAWPQILGGIIDLCTAARSTWL